METAASVLASAKSKPSVPEVIRNIAGSISGEASQKAMTAPKGAPTASIAAMKGITSQEQKGESPPRTAARKIIRTCRPSKARAMRLSAPVALSQATASTAKVMKIPVWASELAVKLIVGTSCG